MIDWLLVLPVVTPLLTAGFLFVAKSDHGMADLVAALGSILQVIGALLLFVFVQEQGTLAIAAGRWAAPFGIVFVADALSATLVLITAVATALVFVISRSDLKKHHSYSLHLVGMQVLTAGIGGAFLTGDLFNLYVWFEVILISSFALLTLDAGRSRIEGATQYVALNLVSTLVFLLAIGVLYGATGSLNFADLQDSARSIPVEYRFLISGLFLFGFCIKAAAFPLYNWLPASYHRLPPAVAILFAALPTKVGIYALVRYFTLVVPLPDSGLQEVLLWVAGGTMLAGILGALAQDDLRRMGSYLIISSIGYLLMGVALYTHMSMTGLVLYIIHAMALKVLLFAAIAYLCRMHGSSKLSDMGGSYRTNPLFALCFLIGAFSLAGFPPLSGFWGKLVLVRAGLEAEAWGIVAVALVTGLMTLVVLLRVWVDAFWRPLPAGAVLMSLSATENRDYLIPVAVAAAFTLVFGVWVAPFYELATSTAVDLLNPASYVRAVLGGSP